MTGTFAICINATNSAIRMPVEKAAAVRGSVTFSPAISSLPKESISSWIILSVINQNCLRNSLC